jgi:hypothetical protein
LGSSLVIYGAEYRIGLMHLGMMKFTQESECSKMHLQVLAPPMLLKVNITR